MSVVWLTSNPIHYSNIFFIWSPISSTNEMLYLKDGRTAHIIFYCGSELNILLVSWHWNMFDQSSLNISAQKEEGITICGFKGCKIWILKFCVEIVGMTASLIIILSERTCSQFSYWQWLLVDNYVVTNLPQHNSSVKSPHETKFANIPLSIHGTSKSPKKSCDGPHPTVHSINSVNRADLQCPV